MSSRPFVTYLTPICRTLIHVASITTYDSSCSRLQVITNPLVKGVVKVNKTIIQLYAEDVAIDADASMITVR